MNRLANETSPYLLQHAGNPVHWFAWGEEAFAAARAEDKPIFLSIGYSTCHWCHVMAHESFEDPAVAEVLNEDFISVKVDREERPDVDRVYMTYVQAITGHGGWPLSAFLAPDLKPFYGGTYYPPADHPGRPGFTTVLRAIARAWREQRQQLLGESERVIEALRGHAGSGGRLAPGADEFAQRARAALARCEEHYEATFDSANGGFGGAPKFPRGANLAFLLRAMEGGAAHRMATATLRRMAQGGIHDHVGGGFHRYSVDGSWFVPHFEKMLYDQAQIATNCLDAVVATGDERFAWVARDIFEYVRRDLTDPRGGFHSAEDADSEVPEGRAAKADAGGSAGHEQKSEGAFYVWTRTELLAALAGSTDEAVRGFAPHFGDHFGVAESGNVPGHLDPQGELRGANILAQRRTLIQTAEAAGLDLERASDVLAASLAHLREVRGRRPRPHLDDKIIAAWNAQMISAFVRGHRILGPDGNYLGTALKAAEFLWREMGDRGSGRLFRTFRGSAARIDAFAEDYALAVQAALDLYEATFSIRWLRWAEKLQGRMDELFWDGEGGGYFNSAAGDPHIVVRLKDGYDGAEPAAGSVAAMNLVRLGAVFDRDPAGKSYRDRAWRTAAASEPQWSRAPESLPQLMCALAGIIEPPRHVVLAGDPASAGFQEMHEMLGRQLRPVRMVLHASHSDSDRAVQAEELSWLEARAPWLADMKTQGGRATAFVCEAFTCRAPVTNLAELKAALG